PQILGLASIGLIGGLLLYRAERLAPEPVIPGRLLRGNVPSLSCVAGFGNSLVWFSVLLLVPVRLQLVLGLSATVAGALFTPGIVLGTAFSFVAGQIMSRTGRYRLTGVTAGILQVASVATLLFLPATTGATWVTLAFLVVSIGASFGGPTFMI